MQIPALQAVTVEILVDNFFDVFEPSRPGIVERVAPGRLPKPLVAAHGLAYLITLNQQGRLTRILMDAANDPLPLFNNLEALGHQPEEIDAVVVSHGHPDHYGGLLGFLAKRLGPLPIYLHEDTYFPKLFITPRGRIGPWILQPEKLTQAGGKLEENRGPQVILDQVLLTGTVELTTGYEKPLPGLQTQGQRTGRTRPLQRRAGPGGPRRGPGPGGHRRLLPPGHRQHGEIRPETHRRG